MKKLVLYLIAMVVSFGLSAQFNHMSPKNIKQIASISTNPNQRNAHWRSVNAYNKQITQGKLTGTKARLDSVYDSGQFHFLQTFAYDTLQQATEYTAYYWANGTWNAGWRELYTYNLAGLLAEIIEQEWNDSLANWQHERKFNYTYNANGSINQYICYHWEQAGNQWLFYTKNEYVYNAQNLLETETAFDWQSGAWVNAWKEHYVYNAHNDISVVFYSNWYNNIWNNMNKTEYSYDANYLLQERKVFYWEEFTSSWINISKYVFLYTAQNQVSQEVYYSWNVMNNVFEPYGKSEYRYSLVGDLDTLTEFYWTGTSWQFEHKNILIHDGQYSFEDLILPPSFYSLEIQTIMSHKLDHYVTLYFNDSTWTIDRNVTLYYTLVSIIGENEFTKPSIAIYPNPTSAWLYIENATVSAEAMLEIYALNGACVAKIPVTNLPIFIGNLAKGMYIWKFNDGHTSSRGKLVIE